MEPTGPAFGRPDDKLREIREQRVGRNKRSALRRFISNAAAEVTASRRFARERRNAQRIAPYGLRSMRAASDSGLVGDGRTPYLLPSMGKDT
jgi:hypothetical protein